MAHDAFKKAADISPATFRLLSDKAISDWLGKGGTIDGLHVLDYGQGDCTAVVDKTNRAIVYFDIGGGKHTGSRTHPWHQAWDQHACHPQAPEFSLQPTIVLSHWDGDHYSTARYLVKPGNKEVPLAAAAINVKLSRWLAPRQCKHPSKLEMAVELGPSLRCWPKGVESHTFELTPRTQMVIEKCDGNGPKEYDPNLDGLAARLERLDKYDDVVERMILPGDAPYKIIPSFENGPPDKVMAMLAYHHGSETHLDDDTIQSIPKAVGGTIAYTFGLKPDGRRCYDHPRTKAIDEYSKAGFTNPVLPSGGFSNWPPGNADLGDLHDNRAHQKIRFAKPDAKATKVFLRDVDDLVG